MHYERQKEPKSKATLKGQYAKQGPVCRTWGAPGNTSDLERGPPPSTVALINTILRRRRKLFLCSRQQQATLLPPPFPSGGRSQAGA